MPLCTGGGIPSRQEGERLEREQEEEGEGGLWLLPQHAYNVCVYASLELIPAFK